MATAKPTLTASARWRDGDKRKDDMAEPLIHADDKAPINRDHVKEAAEAVARAWKAHGASPLLEPYMAHLIEVLER